MQRDVLFVCLAPYFVLFFSSSITSTSPAIYPPPTYHLTIITTSMLTRHYIIVSIINTQHSTFSQSTQHLPTHSPLLPMNPLTSHRHLIAICTQPTWMPRTPLVFRCCVESWLPYQLPVPYLRSPCYFLFIFFTGSRIYRCRARYQCPRLHCIWWRCHHRHTHLSLCSLCPRLSVRPLYCVCMLTVHSAVVVLGYEYACTATAAMIWKEGMFVQ